MVIPKEWEVKTYAACYKYLKSNPNFWISHSSPQCTCFLSYERHVFPTPSLPLLNPELKLILQEKTPCLCYLKNIEIHVCQPLLLFYFVQHFLKIRLSISKPNFCLPLPFCLSDSRLLTTFTISDQPPFCAVVPAVLSMEGNPHYSGKIPFLGIFLNSSWTLWINIYINNFSLKHNKTTCYNSV